MHVTDNINHSIVIIYSNSQSKIYYVSVYNIESEKISWTEFILKNKSHFEKESLSNA